jgi:hypothetical protein
MHLQSVRRAWNCSRRSSVAQTGQVQGSLDLRRMMLQCARGEQALCRRLSRLAGRKSREEGSRGDLSRAERDAEPGERAKQDGMNPIAKDQHTVKSWGSHRVPRAREKLQQMKVQS